MQRFAAGLIVLVVASGLIGVGCAGAGGATAIQDGNREADRRALQRLMEQGADVERPVDVARTQLEAGWIHRRFIESLAPQDVLAEVRLVPATAQADGQPEGFRVAWLGHTARRLMSVGLRDDDVVVALNGQDIRDPQAFAAAIEGLRRAAVVEIDLVRDGQPVRLVADVRDEQP